MRWCCGAGGCGPCRARSVTLVSPEATAPYTGMLPGHVAGHYPREALDIDLVRLARFAGARFIPGRVVALDPEARVATLASGRRLRYDIASLDIGITAEMPHLPGFAEHGIPAKPLDRFRRALGGGGGGVRPGADRRDRRRRRRGGIAMACAFRLKAEGREAGIALIDRGRILGSVPAAARAPVRRWPDGRSTIVRRRRAARGAGRRVSAGERRRCGRPLIGAAGARPQGWLAARARPSRRVRRGGRRLSIRRHPTSMPRLATAPISLPDPRPQGGCLRRARRAGPRP
jgi:selenide,water dikinase